MDAFIILLVCVVLLMVLVSRLYRQNPRPETADADADARVDRLATLLDPDVMVALSEEARRRQCSELQLVNDLLRPALGGEGRPAPPRE